MPPDVWVFVRVVVLTFAVAAVVRMFPIRRRIYYTGSALIIPPLCGALVGILVLASVAWVVMRKDSPSRVSVPNLAHDRELELGVFEPVEQQSYDAVIQFGRKVGRQPKFVVSYTSWPTQFNATFAATVDRHRAVPIVNWLPFGVSMDQVVAGEQDTYIRSFAESIRSYGHSVVLSFAPEANGNWYSYSLPRTQPQVLVAAYRHVVDIFRASGVHNVTWLWTLSQYSRYAGGTYPAPYYWPGPHYVDWIGIDGYYYVRGQTFANTFGPILDDLRQISQKPVLISETAIGPEAGQMAKLPDLFAGIRANRIAGLIWYDQRQSGSVIRQDWTLVGPAIKLFREELKYSSRP